MTIQSEQTALIGAGEAAKKYLKWSGVETFSVFTSDGIGALEGIEVQPLSQITTHNYTKVIIASQYVADILDVLIRNTQSLENVFWFDELFLRLGHVIEMGYIEQKRKKPLYAVYDMRVYPPTFDIASFMVQADIERQKRSLDSICLVVLKGRFAGLSARAMLNHGREHGRWRLENIIYPIASMTDYCDDICVLSTTEQVNNLIGNAESFPLSGTDGTNSVHYALGPIINALNEGYTLNGVTASNKAIETAKQLLQKLRITKPFICISLREYEHQLSRNSKASLNQQYIQIAKDRGLDVVIIRDTEKALIRNLVELDGQEAELGAFSLSIRQALYELATLNISVSSGPSCGLMMLSRRVNYFITNVLDESQWNCNREFLEGRQGITIGRQLPFSNQKQRICWETDESKILEEFTDFLEGIVKS